VAAARELSGKNPDRATNLERGMDLMTIQRRARHGIFTALVIAGREPPGIGIVGVESLKISGCQRLAICVHEVRRNTS
jgi:hypothetical protein